MSEDEAGRARRSFASLWRHLRQQTHDILEVGGAAHPLARAVDAFIITLIVANAVAFALGTVEPFATQHRVALNRFNWFSVAAFTIEYVLRLWSAVDIPLLRREPPWKARLHYAARPIMIIDLLAFAPFYLHWLIPIDLRMLRIFRLFRLLKLVRYSPALQSLQKVFVQEWRALFGSLLVMLVLLIFCSTLMYYVESAAQPDKFGSVPASIWWGLETLTTVGYGDAVPVTPIGKVVGGVVMLLGLAAIALPVAIIATGFNQESNRHEFVVTWGMIARVPLFASFDAAEIAEVAKLVYARVYPPGAPIVTAGEAGGAMYIIESGEAVGHFSGGRLVTFKAGDFFGEMALLEHRRHQHDIVAKTHARVYILDSIGLAELERRHPEMLQMIRKVSKERQRESAAREAAQVKPRRRPRSKSSKAAG